MDPPVSLPFVYLYHVLFYNVGMVVRLFVQWFRTSIILFAYFILLLLV